MLVGEPYPDIYVTRLHSMLERNLHTPFVLHCITDRKRNFPAAVQTIDCSKWTEMRRDGMRLTTNKIRLLDPELFPFDEFLYLDVTLVIQSSMADLVEFAMASPKDLIIVKDWNYNCYNSCVMRIRRSEALGKVHQLFVEGKKFKFRNPGDQDFIHSAVCELGLQDRVEYFKPDHVVSWRNLRDINRKNPQAAYDAIAKGTIVKFFGRPKMHQLLDPVYCWTKIRLRRFRTGHRDSTFWKKELRKHWN
jgi:hypothetical protein